MNDSHTHPGRECDGLCHLNDEARHRYWQLRRGGCPEHAEMLRAHGVWA